MFDDPEPGPRLEGEPDPVVPGDLAPRLSETELVCDIWSAQSRQAREYAMELVAIARLARRRRRDDLMARGARGGPGVDSRALAAPELADVTEDFVPELALIRGCTEAEALVLARESILLTTTLEPTWCELYAGRIGVRHLKVMVDLLSDASPEVAAEVQRRVLPHAERITAPALRDRVRRQLYRLDAAAKERRRREAAKKAGMHVWPKDEGLSTLGIDMPTLRCVTAQRAIDEYAQMLRADGDQRPIGVLHSEAAWNLLLRPWDTSRPPVTAHVVVHAQARALRPDGDPGQSQEPCEVEGQVVSAAECRELLRELAIIGIAEPPVGGSVAVAVGDPVTGEVIAVATRAELRRGAGVGRRRRRRRGPRSLVGRPDEAADGPGLTPPPDTSAYEPTAAQKRHVHVRDRRCRMPGCRRRPGRVDLDHGQAYECGGPTACWNLCCLCRRHHRIKTFARGWHFELLRDGWLIVRTPSGVTRMTRPPGWCYDAEPEPPWLEDLAPPDPMLT